MNQENVTYFTASTLRELITNIHSRLRGLTHVSANHQPVQEL
jgi:hypothetical protein